MFSGRILARVLRNDASTERKTFIHKITLQFVASEKKDSQELHVLVS